MQGYYFEIEKRDDNALTFAYIWRIEDDEATAPPAKSFHSMADNAGEVVNKAAEEWVKERGVLLIKNNQRRANRIIERT